MYKFLLLISFLAVSCQNQSQSTAETEVKQGICEDISMDDFISLMAKDTSISIIDVRTPGEIADGKITPKAIEIDYHGNFKDEINKLDKSKTHYLYCGSGVRSKKACTLMTAIGFKKNVNVLGGYSEWVSKKSDE